MAHQAWRISGAKETTSAGHTPEPVFGIINRDGISA
jgi:hypothetical protein